MRKLVGVMLVSLFITALHSTPRELFSQANRLVQAGDYAGAYAQYESIADKGSAVWYNLGICDYMRERYPEAIVCWRRAQQGGSYRLHRDAEQNITAAREAMNFACDAGWRTHGLMIARALVVPISSGLLQLLLVLLLCCAVGLYCARRRIKRYISVLSTVVLLLTCLSTGAVVVKYHTECSAHAVIVAEGARLFSGPSEEYHVVHLCQKGEQLVLLQQRDQWIKASCGDKMGWIPSLSVCVI